MNASHIKNEISRMNEYFAKHDAELEKTGKVNLGMCRYYNLMGQKIKTRLLQQGVVLTNSPNGVFALDKTATSNHLLTGCKGNA